MAETTKQETPYLRKIDFAEIDDFTIVGRGSYGTVYKARWQNDYVAVKGFEFEADPKAIETEVKQLSRVVHPNIILLYGVSIAHSRIYLVMEYAEGGSLHNFLHGAAKPFYSAAHAMSWARQCAEGVAYLHGMRPKPLIHRDLKPLNLLLVNKGRNLKICDFGTVADKSTLMTNNRGSAAWMAPEVFRGSSYTEKCDVFSWAIILWQIITREQPYKDFGLALSIMWYVNQGHRPPLITGCPKQIEKLMTSCWDQEPENRPSMDHVVEIMKALCEFFPGADEPLEYRSPHEQYDSNRTSDQQYESSNNRILEIENLSLNDNNNNTNNTSSTTPTNPGKITQINHAINQHVNAEKNLKSSIFKGNELETLSEEVESKFSMQNSNDSSTNKDNDDKININFNSNSNSNSDTHMDLTRINEIRNGMLKNQYLPLEPLSIQVDPNAWELNHDYRNFLENIAKSEGKERLTVTEKKSDSSAEDISDNNCSNEATNATIGVSDDTEKALHLMLDPELQPETPDPNSQLSQEIFQEHQKLAKEFLRVDTELYYATDRKEKLLASMDPDEKQEKLTIIKKLMEKEDLLGLYKDLQKQLEQIKIAQGLSESESSRNIVQEQQQQHQQQSSSSSQMVLKASTDEEPPDQNEDGWVFITSNQS